MVPWLNAGYVCVIDGTRTNNLPDLAALYTRQRASLAGGHPNAPSDFPPDSLVFETRVETDASAGRRTVQRWMSTIRQGKRNTTTTDATAMASPVIVLLHASNAGCAAATTGADGWSLGHSVTNRRRIPQLTALNEFPVVPLGGTLDESDTQTTDELDLAADAYSLMNWQQTAVKRGIRYFIQVGRCFVSALCIHLCVIS